MRTRMLRTWAALLATAGLIACDGDPPGGDAGPPGDAGIPDDASTDTDGASPDVDSGPLEGEAGLSFEPRWGRDYNLQINANWRPSMPFWDGDSRVVIMLCETSDATCESPVLVRAIRDDETDGDPIQGGFGPAITATGLPEGTFRLMIFADNPTSVGLGYGFDDGFETTETAWGGVVSEGDSMMTAPDATTSGGVNPEPMTVEVTLADGERVDLGVVALTHLHERDLSPPRPTETGRMVVATEGGVRVIDLATWSVQEVIADSGFYTFQMTDAGGDAVDGTVCGAVRGQGDVVWVLYSGGAGAGFAVPFDAGTLSQLHGGNVVTFPGSTTRGPCAGLAVERAGRQYLYLNAKGASGIDPPVEGLWYADVTDIGAGDVAGTFMDRNDDEIIQVGIGALTVHDGELYASISPGGSDDFAPSECRGAHCAFRATLDAAGRPTFAGTGGYDFLVGPDQGGSVMTSSGEVTCNEIGEIGYAGLAIAPFHDGRDLLFLGGCTEIVVYDLADDSRLDYNGALPGRPGVNGTLFGNGFTHLVPSPDGSILWAVPQSKSAIHFNYQLGSDPSRRQTFNRYMALPIALDSGTDPAVHADFATGDMDGFEGMASIGVWPTPADDPGVNLNYGRYISYQMQWASSTAGSTFGSSTIPTGPTFAVTGSTLWMRGAGVAGNSGMGKAGNVAVFDLQSRQALLFAAEGEDFYHYWQGGLGDQPQFGYDLTPENENFLATYALVYVP